MLNLCLFLSFGICLSKVIFYLPVDKLFILKKAIIIFTRLTARQTSLKHQEVLIRSQEVNRIELVAFTLAFKQIVNTRFGS